jgi:hypothetical protein
MRRDKGRGKRRRKGRGKRRRKGRGKRRRRRKGIGRETLVKHPRASHAHCPPNFAGIKHGSTCSRSTYKKWEGER